MLKQYDPTRPSSRRGLRHQIQGPVSPSELYVSEDPIYDYIVEHMPIFCQDQIGEGYFQNLLLEASTLLWYISTKDGAKAFSFAMCTVHDNTLHLNLVCGTYGGELVEECMKYAQATQKTYFELEAVNMTVLSIYRKNLKNVFGNEAFFDYGLASENEDKKLSSEEEARRHIDDVFTLGLAWHPFPFDGTPSGQELVNEALSDALETKLVFTGEEWRNFGVNLKKTHFVKKKTEPVIFRPIPNPALIPVNFKLPDKCADFIGTCEDRDTYAITSALDTAEGKAQALCVMTKGTLDFYADSISLMDFTGVTGECLLENIESLNVKTTSIPAGIEKLHNLRNFSVKNVNLESLPESILMLKNLMTLDVSQNQLKSLPETIGTLKNLVTLDVSQNQLNSLPESIGTLENLMTLNVSENQLKSLKSLPESTRTLRNLMELDVSKNQLNSLPAFIGILELETLKLGNNQFRSFPKEIEDMANFNGGPRVLDVSSNKLESLPEWIGEVWALEDLNLRSNELSSLPESMVNLKKLDRLDISRNPLTHLPESLGPFLRKLNAKFDDKMDVDGTIDINVKIDPGNDGMLGTADDRVEATLMDMDEYEAPMSSEV